jgi:hypothetical protein
MVRNTRRRFNGEERVEMEKGDVTVAMAFLFNDAVGITDSGFEVRT